METLPDLYIKSTCPWCNDAREYFEKKGVRVNLIDVAENHGSIEKLIALTGQSSVPTFNYKGFIVKDFDISEFEDALHSAPPKIRKELNL